MFLNNNTYSVTNKKKVGRDMAAYASRSDRVSQQKLALLVDQPQSNFIKSTAKSIKVGRSGYVAAGNCLPEDMLCKQFTLLAPMLPLQILEQIFSFV